MRTRHLRPLKSASSESALEMRRRRPRLNTPIGELAACLVTNHRGEQEELLDQDEDRTEKEDEVKDENSECEKDGRCVEEASLSAPQNVDLSSVESIREMLRASSLQRPVLPSLFCLDGQLAVRESSGNVVVDVVVDDGLRPTSPPPPPTRAAQTAGTLRWRRDADDAAMDERRRQPRPQDQPSLFGIEERRLRRKQVRKERRLSKQVRKFRKQMQRFESPRETQDEARA